MVRLILWAVCLSTICLSASGKESVDLIVKGDFVVTMDPGDTVLEKGAVVVQGNRIIDVLPQSLAAKRYRANRTIPGENRVVMPGLINAHTHSAMTLFRGMVDDLDLMTWLNDYVFPMENQFVTPEFVQVGSTLACYEMIRGGTTTFVDMYFYPDIIAEVVDRCGLRAVITAPHIDFPSPGFKGWDDSFAAAIDFVTRWQGRHARIRPGFAPHAPYTVSPEHLSATVDVATRLKAPISMHLSEDPSEVQQIEQRYGATPVQHVSKLGVLSDSLIAAHMVVLNKRDMALTAAAGTGAIHNPTSNLKVGAGVAAVPAMLKAGIHVGLGTDGAASNNDLDLWEEIRLAALLHKGESGDPTAMPAVDALALATRSGAAAIDWDDDIGQLTPGRQADLIQLEFDKIRHLPLYDIVSHLVYVLDSNDVVTTVVAGSVLMENREVLTIDRDELREDVIRVGQKIQDALSQDR